MAETRVISENDDCTYVPDKEGGNGNQVEDTGKGAEEGDNATGQQKLWMAKREMRIYTPPSTRIQQLRRRRGKKRRKTMRLTRNEHQQECRNR